MATVQDFERELDQVGKEVAIGDRSKNEAEISCARNIMKKFRHRQPTATEIRQLERGANRSRFIRRAIELVDHSGGATGRRLDEAMQS